MMDIKKELKEVKKETLALLEQYEHNLKDRDDRMRRMGVTADSLRRIEDKLSPAEKRLLEKKINQVRSKTGRREHPRDKATPKTKSRLKNNWV